MFERDLHPLLFDQIERKLASNGIVLHPSDPVSHPADMQFLVKENVGLGLVAEGLKLHPELTSRPIEGVRLNVETAFISRKTQQRPVLPLLAYRVAKVCADKAATKRKKPPGRVSDIVADQSRKMA